MTESTENKALANYARTLDDLEESERERRLKIIRDFSAAVDRNPDQMIEEIFDRATMKYRKRGFYLEKVREFSSAGGAPRSTAVFVGNVIRAFFIANGLRIPPERPSWM